jgi:hypothetical protein
VFHLVDELMNEEEEGRLALVETVTLDVTGQLTGAAVGYRFFPCFRSLEFERLTRVAQFPAAE